MINYTACTMSTHLDVVLVLKLVLNKRKKDKPKDVIKPQQGY